MTEKFALITGGGVGIGKASALALAREGWNVAVAGRRLEPLQTAAKAIEALGRRALALTSDVGDPASVKQLFEQIEREFGRLDLLFNNAGVSAPAVPMEELTYEQWKSGRRRQSDRRLPVRAGRDPADEETDAAGRTHHQQRFDFRAIRRARTPRPIRRPSTPLPGSPSRSRSTGVRSTSPADRSTSATRLTEMAFRMTQGVPQADGRIAIEPTMDANEVGAAVAHMASLPLSTNILTMTIMATKMPLVGRG